MIFWIVVIALTCAVGAMMVAPLLRVQTAPQDNPDVTIYRAQLAEIDRDLERNLLDPDEAARSRTEIARRLLAAAAVGPEHFSAARRHAVLGAAVLVFTAVTSFAIYRAIGAPGYGDVPLQARIAASDAMRANRPAQATLELLSPPPPPVAVPQDYRDAIVQLRQIAPTRPDDIEAWSRLTRAEVELRNYAAAAAAQEQVIRIRGADATPNDRHRLLDLRVVAAGGIVSPEAETLIRNLLAGDENDVPARYYLGLLYDQTDRPDLAFRLWRDLADSGDPNTFHVASARALIENAAFRAGVDYTLPTVRGPSSADIAAAQDMSAEDRAQMIGGMVAALADRLATDGGSAADWARLITAYGVMGATEDARAIWVKAADVFGADPAAMQVLTEAASGAGVLE